jgi:hypothetical protein
MTKIYVKRTPLLVIGSRLIEVTIKNSQDNLWTLAFLRQTQETNSTLSHFFVYDC